MERRRRNAGSRGSTLDAGQLASELARPLLCGRARRVVALLTLVLGAVLFVGVFSTTAAERVIRISGFSSSGVVGDGEGLVMPFDRDTKRRVDDARKALDAGRYSDAVQLLDRVLQRSEDFFYKQNDTREVGGDGSSSRPSGDSKDSLRSVKAEAESILGSMPDDARKSYELQFGVQAEKQLADAVAAGDQNAVAEVSRRFFHTRSGYEATLLLGKYYLDHGLPLAASLSLNRLMAAPQARKAFEPSLSLLLAAAYQRAGMQDKAVAVLTKLKAEWKDRPLTLGGQPVRLFEADKDAPLWIAKHLGTPSGNLTDDETQWAMYRGNAQRNATSAGGSPLLTSRWRISTTNDPEQEKDQLALRQSLTDRGIAAIPAMHPLAVGDTVIMRTISSRSPSDTVSYDLLAVDFATGKRIWKPLPKSDNSASRGFDRMALINRMRFGQQPGGSSNRRGWDDATLGTMSSDGQCVFYIDELGLAPRRPSFSRRMEMVLDGPSSTTNKLVALELKTQGKLKWEIGGPSGEVEPQLADAFFLGPPLPLGDALYVLVEIKQDIRLAVLNPRTGRLLWSQRLAEVEKSVGSGAPRRYAGASPSFAEGILICPTSAGAVVTVDLDRRSLMWGFQYQQNASNSDVNAMMRARNVATSDGNDRWLDATSCVADGCVLFTPIESDQLYCLDLASGALRWKYDRGDNLYVGCASGGKVLLVGRRQVQALSLSTGKPAWKKTGGIDLPPGAMPSGRGFFSGHDYYLPLSTAEVARINLDRGEIIERVKSRKATVPGNLICYKGEVISQGIDCLEAFFQLEPLKGLIAEKLAKNPDDSWALTRRGQIQLELGKPKEALVDIRKAFEQDQSAPTRELLVEAMLGSLRIDFAGQRSLLPEMEQLIDSDVQWSEYLRIKGEGLEKAGDIQAAFEAYMKLADLAGDRDDLDEARNDLTIRRDRWVRGRLAALYEAAPASERQRVDKLIRDRLTTATDEKSAKSLERFVAVFGDLKIADEARKRLVSELSGSESLIARETLLRKLERSPEPAEQRYAVAQLAQLLREARRVEDAAIYYRRLGSTLANEQVLGKQTGASMVADLSMDDPIRVLLNEPRPWPRGAVKSQGASQTLGRHFLARPMATELRGDTSPFFDGMSLAIDQRSALAVVGRDAMGQERFRIQLNDSMSRGDYSDSVINFAETDGHLLILHYGYQIYAIDTLRPGGRLLWQQRAVEPAFSSLGQVGRISPNTNTWGISRRTVTGPNNQPLSNSIALIGDDVIIQSGRDIVALDRLSGQKQWVFHGAPPGCELFGNGQELFIVPQDDGSASADYVEAMTLDPRDGSALGLRKLPKSAERWATSDRHVLVGRQASDTKSSAGGKQSTSPGLELAVLDAASGEERRIGPRFAVGSKCTLVEDDKVAILETGGNFYLFDWTTGKQLIADTLEADRHLQGLQVIGDRERYFVVAQLPSDPDRAGKVFMSGPFADMSPLLSGKIYAFDRAKARKLWPVPVIIDQYALVAGMNSDMPALVLVRNANRSDPPTELTGSLLCLDKRTGRTIYSNLSLPGGIGTFDVSADREAATMSVQVGGASTLLRFTSDPVAPEPPYQADLELPSQSASKAGKGKAGLFMRIFRRAAKELGTPYTVPPEE